MADEVAKDASEHTGERERRASARMALEMWVEEITEGSQVFRRAGNLSRGGMYLDQTIPLPVGSMMSVTMR